MTGHNSVFSDDIVNGEVNAKDLSDIKVRSVASSDGTAFPECDSGEAAIAGGYTGIDNGTTVNANRPDPPSTNPDGWSIQTDSTLDAFTGYVVCVSK